MATVADLLLLLKDKLLPYERAYGVRGANDAALIRALNSGKWNVWMTAVRTSHASDGNWFSKQDSLVIGVGDNDIALPSDFHSLLSVSSSSVKLRPTAWRKQVWRDDRAKTGNVDPATVEVLYYIVGGDASSDPVLHLSRPTTGFSAELNYTARLADWTASGDSVDAMPEVFHDAVVTWAAAALIAAAQDSEISRLFHEKWKDAQELIEGVCTGRQFAGIVSDEDYDSDG